MARRNYRLGKSTGTVPLLERSRILERFRAKNDGSVKRPMKAGAHRADTDKQ